MQIRKEEIALVTTIFNRELYDKTSNSFPSDILRFYINGTKGFYGLHSILFSIKKLYSKGYKWIVMADEDVIFTKPDATYKLIQYMKKNSYSICGMRDGGTLKWRNKNPHSINTFFSIINLDSFINDFKPRAIKMNQYIKPNEFSLNDIGINYKNYDESSLFEDYYCFYLWLQRKNKKILFLDAECPNNNETTRLFDHNGVPLLYHTWYARFYKRDIYHTKRIDSLLKEHISSQDNAAPKLLKNPIFNLRFFFYSRFQRISRPFRNN